MSSNNATARSDCPSCGTPRSGRYCAHCGEQFLRAEDFDFRHFLIRHVVRELFEFDGKIARTVKVLFLEPGRLAADYVAGRRQPYISPLRLYLVVFLVHAFLVTMVEGHRETLPEHIRTLDSTGLLTRLVNARAGIDWSNPELVAELSERAHWLKEGGNLLIFFGIAAIQSLTLYRLHRRYLEHVALALNVSAFLIVVVVAVELFLALFHRQNFTFLSYQGQQAAALTLLPLYWWFAIRHFYGIKGAYSILATAVIVIGSLVVATLLNSLMFGLLIATA
jgi:Protein of unknown function (DUF3667)